MARFLLLLFLLFGCFISHAQVNISIYADTVRVLQNTDCDGFLSGDSDFGWLFNARDNNTGLRNNSPVANLYIDSASYATVNGNNGAFAMLPANWCTNAMGGLFFNRNYASCGTMPSSIRIKWLAYENDDALCWANSIAGEGVTSIDSFDVAVGPANSTQTFIRSGASGGICPQQYRISFRVVVTFTSLTGMNMYFADLDGDGFGNRTIFIMACSPLRVMFPITLIATTPIRM